MKNSPGIDTHKPVSRQHEIEYLDYYQYPHYWGGGEFWGDGMMWLGMGSGRTPSIAPSGGAGALHANAVAADGPGRGDLHLRSRNEISGYDVSAADGHIGHVRDLLLEEKGWAIRFIIVNTGIWWSGHRVVIAPQWITGVSWEERTVAVSLTRDAVKRAPPYSPGVEMGRDEEARIYEHYDRPGYWAREVNMQNPEFNVISRP